MLSAANVQPLSLKFGETESFLYQLSNIGSTSYITRIDAATGAILWHYTFNGVNDLSSSMEYGNFGTEVLIAATKATSASIKFARMTLLAGAI